MFLSKKESEFRKSYSEYYPLVISKIYSKVGNIEDAKDICHDLFISYYHKLETIENSRSWLLAALKYEISNHYRKRGVSNREKIDIDNIEDDPNLVFENGFRDIRIVINEAIENDGNYKDEKEKLLFKLIAINNFTYEETAQQLELSKRQIEYKYAQVLKRIISYLKNKGISKIEDLL